MKPIATVEVDVVQSMPERSEVRLLGRSGDISHIQSRNDWRRDARIVQSGVQAVPGGVGGKNEGGKRVQASASHHESRLTLSPAHTYPSVESLTPSLR